MDRSRSKRNYYYDHQDYDNERTSKPRYNHHYNTPNPHRHRGGFGGSGGGGGGGGYVNNNRFVKQDSPLTVTTSYRILCHDMRAGGVIGKSGCIIKSIRQHTGAHINVHELIPGDEERIIEISDTRRRDPEGRMPSFSPAQEALFLIHDRIVESDVQFGVIVGGDDEYGGGRGGGNRVVTRLVVSRMHVGSLLGKGGKIIEQMRIETKTQIRILPRDHNLPRCVSMSEEIVQVSGDINAVKNAISIISSRLRESQHRDRSHFGKMRDGFFPDDDYIPHMNNPRRSSIDGPSFGSRSPATNYRGSFNSRQSGPTAEAGPNPMMDSSQIAYMEELVFRILCPIDKIDKVIGESDGIIELLQNEIGVDVKVADPSPGSDEQIIVISSEEGPDDELFPAQEALLHIQSHIVDLIPDKENIVQTRLLIQSSEMPCLEGKDGSLSDLEKLTGAKVQILPKEKLPTCVAGADELLQIEGEIMAARVALVEVTSRLRSYLYKNDFQKETPPPVSTSGSMGVETASPNSIAPGNESHSAGDAPSATPPSVQSAATAQQSKDVGLSGAETAKQTESVRRDDVPSKLVMPSAADTTVTLQIKTMEETTGFDLPGFRFHPTEEELLEFYLRNMVSGKKLRCDIIGFLNIYHHDPWELPDMAKIGEREWYFFVPRDRKQGHGGRPNRTTAKGFWKATGSDRKIFSFSDPKRIVGYRKTLVFYKGRAPRGSRTDWVMSEYRLLDSHPLSNDLVLCKIYRKATSLKVLEQRAAMEEEMKTVNHHESLLSTASSPFSTTSFDNTTISFSYQQPQDQVVSPTRLPEIVKKELEDEKILVSSLQLPLGIEKLPELEVPKWNMDWNQDEFWWFNSPSLQNLTSCANILNF